LFDGLVSFIVGFDPVRFKRCVIAKACAGLIDGICATLAGNSAEASQMLRQAFEVAGQRSGDSVIVGSSKTSL
jgi:2-methylcitrate dehydratase PrpD